ncbi:ribosome small subunit-dependent GTPase A [Desulfovibrio sp. PG-178-WT-4]|uniref:Small ribosomal subunit biogenesis GTPase RsgA n=1 Tax=Desulfovibrio porci TaxID=2605782 RepID=A0A6L5XIT6_9BACT|nr:ribosome small subunit-dependent GTPase A [Desulfovibrio porci]MSS27047.1 ribosome small subunit-dependent GTPase A [Desulfovibrio porci]
MNILIDYGAGDGFFAEAALYPDRHLARITSQHKGLYKVMTNQGEKLAEISGKFRHNAIALSRYPAVGDFVMLSLPEADAGHAVIHHVLQRKSAFTRKAVGLEEQTQLVAANIDIVFICMSLNNDYNLSRLERYLSVAWNSRALPVIILTKADLYADVSHILDEISALAPGVDVVTTSINDQSSHDGLRSYLKPGITASFIGSSGVGKSTLINLLAGKEVLRTSQVGQDDKGMHTTTRRELLLLPQGGIVIDTPGMRELGVEFVDLSRSFADIENLAMQCRFDDCTHGAEPGCAVKRALETGALDERRWANYQKLKRETRYRGLSSRQLESEKLNGMFENIGGMKKARAFLRQTDKRR